MNQLGLQSAHHILLVPFLCRRFSLHEIHRAAGWDHVSFGSTRCSQDAVGPKTCFCPTTNEGQRRCHQQKQSPPAQQHFGDGAPHGDAPSLAKRGGSRLLQLEALLLAWGHGAFGLAPAQEANTPLLKLQGHSGAGLESAGLGWERRPYPRALPAPGRTEAEQRALG